MGFPGLGGLKWIGGACVAGMLAWPAHAGMGDDFGTRDPAVCPIRTIPSKGAPSMQQVVHYLACDTEKVGDLGATMYLLSEVRLRVDPKGRPYDPKSDSFAADADAAQPVYGIRGDFRVYLCSRNDSPEGLADPGHACRYQNFYDHAGLCWEDGGSDWHCAIPYEIDLAHTVHGVTPPRAGSFLAIGANASTDVRRRASGAKHRKKHHH
ncbi:MAG TPA: hypothetical protein VGH80_04135 [Xanthomonadaceae bacterium]|jgi:hypothetical protein